LLYDIHLSLCLSVSDNSPTASAQPSSDMQWQKGTYNTSFVPAALASCVFEITLQDPASHIRITESLLNVVYSDNMSSSRGKHTREICQML